MTEKEDRQRREIEELTRKIESLEATIADMAQPYKEAMDLMDRFREMASNYLRIIGLYQQHGRLSPDMLVPGLKDPIARDILVILFEKPDMNISQISEALRAKRGSASRKTVREKLRMLEELGAVEAAGGNRTRAFRASEDLVDRWLRLLGVMK